MAERAELQDLPSRLFLSIVTGLFVEERNVILLSQLIILEKPRMNYPWETKVGNDRQTVTTTQRKIVQRTTRKKWKSNVKLNINKDNKKPFSP